jgi:hypothetical protein
MFRLGNGGDDVDFNADVAWQFGRLDRGSRGGLAVK